jgi:hypothetical protein
MGRHKRVTATCVHYWLIDDFNQGVCKKCREKRDFAAEMRKPMRPAPYPNPRNTRE